MRNERYGGVKIGSTKYLAHNIAWLLTCGFLPRKIHVDLKVLHICDNTMCVNPNHLYLGTQHDNLVDSYVRGRRERRSPNPYWHGRKKEPT